MSEVRPVTYAEILGAPNAKELLEEYAAECSLAELGPVDPQPETYAAMERTGAFQCFGVFAEGALAGFASVLVWTVPHYNKRMATVESMFVPRAQRGGGTGSNLLTAIEEYARRRGCVAVQYSAPVGSRFARLLFLCGMDYRNSNHVFMKRL